MFLRRLAAAALGACLGLAAAPTAHARAAPSKAELTAAVEDAGLALGYHQQGQWAQAAKHGQAALAVFGPAFGWGEGKVVAPVVVVTVDSLMKLGRNAEADAILSKVKAARGEAKPEPKPQRADAQTPLDQANRSAAEAFTAFVQGRYDEALRLGTEAVAQIEAIDPQAKSLPQMRSMLASLHHQRLEFSSARALLEANLQASRAAGDLVAQGRWTRELASNALLQGKLSEAHEGYTRAAALGVRADDLATQASAEGGLGDVAELRDDQRAALAHYRRALAMHERRPDIGATHLVAPLHDLGVALEEAGQFEEAEAMLTRAVAIAERGFGKHTPATWSTKHALGRLYRSKGDHDAAVVLFEQVLSEQEAQLAPTSPGIAATLNHLAESLWARGDAPPRIVGLATRAAEIHEHQMSTVLRSGTEGQKRAYLERYTSGSDRILSYAVRDARIDPGAVRLGAATVLRRKGRLLDAVSDQFALLRERADASTRAKLERLAAVQAQLSALALRGPDGQLGAGEHAALTKSLRAELERLDGELADVVPPDERSTVQLHEVAAQLDADEALVEFATYRPFDVNFASMNTAFGAERYAAFVVHGDGTTAVVDLGEAARVDEAIVAYRRVLANPRSDPRRIGAQLHGWLVAKFEPHLAGKTSVYLSPDGMLNLLPFAALVDEKGRFLVERYAFTYLSSGRDLLRLSKTERPREAPLLVGSPEFSSGGSGGSAGTRSAGLSDLVFPPLPGTAEELDALSKVVPGAVVRRGAEATESVIKSAHGPLVLHVATHGFFLADTREAARGGRGVTYVKGEAFVPPSTAENPLIRSGLALAGANLRSGPDGQDGILTALELASTDLHGTELVVLSACETGVGEVRNGDGVYGLRRALVIAGSRSQLMSLWQVDDEATRDLMTDYYEKVDRGLGRSEALRKVQRKMLRKKATAHPYYWAAFIPSGDAGALELELPEAKQPGRRERPSGALREYWADSFDGALLTVGGSYLGVVGTPRLEGAAADHRRGWDLRVRGFTRPHIQLGLDYSRQLWRVPSSPRRTKVNVNHLEFVFGVDVFPFPYAWKVRPALVPYGALGLAWGRNRDSPPGELGRDDALLGGFGATFGTDVVLYINPRGKVLVGLRGGISKPYYRLRSDGDRLPYDTAFPRALRWQVGIDIGATP
ncbi:MAG: CHAT domain-containing protein [bacterium]|nr:CHAT domain-containing protein [bacterium]